MHLNYFIFTFFMNYSLLNVIDGKGISFWCVRYEIYVVEYRA